MTEDHVEKKTSITLPENNILLPVNYDNAKEILSILYKITMTTSFILFFFLIFNYKANPFIINIFIFTYTNAIILFITIVLYSRNILNSVSIDRKEIILNILYFLIHIEIYIYYLFFDDPNDQTYIIISYVCFAVFMILFVWVMYLEKKDKKQITVDKVLQKVTIRIPNDIDGYEVDEEEDEEDEEK